jgi:L-lactate dehydrogenase (cytochrome)
VFTVDLPMPGLRHRDTRNAMTSPTLTGKLARARQLLARPGWLWRVGVRGKPHSFGSIAHLLPSGASMPAFAAWVGDSFDPTVTWDDIAWLRSAWKGRILLKGIQEVDDARQAHAVGADGLVVSNHGARQLDSVASSITKLPAVADAVGGRMEVLLDGGVRSGLDVFKALALGANGVLIGRSWIWAMAGAGEAGVRNLLTIWQQELRVAMALSGVNRIAEIDRQILDDL